VRDREEALTRHLADCLALLPVIEAVAGTGLRSGGAAGVCGGGGGIAPESAALRVIDVGTGPGLPGMVLAAARPGWRVTLLDSLRKRCDFLQRAAQAAGACMTADVPACVHACMRVRAFSSYEPHCRHGMERAPSTARENL
jgi:16S rRNA G527 N7-methylase RsmG